MNPQLSEADTVERRYWEVGAVARMVGAESSSQVRFWENHFGILTMRAHSGKRKYTREDIETIRTIRRLAHWFKLDRAKEIFRQGRSETILGLLEPKNG